MLPENEARAFAREHWENIDKWAGDFVLEDGSVIRRTEDGTNLERDGIVVQSLTQEFLIEKRNGNEYHAIDLRMPLSRADFLCRLCESELYQKTKLDGKILADNSNWEAEISVVNLTINGVECRTVWHKPDGIRFKSQGGYSINLSRSYTNQYGHIQYSSHTYSTKELFLVHKKNGRSVCLSVELSCIEFTKTLFDCGHVMFQSYPPYTIQGMPNGRFTYYYYGDFGKPVWHEKYSALKTAEIEMQKAEDKKRKEKEILKKMWNEKHEEHKRVLKAQQEANKRIMEDQQKVNEEEIPQNEITTKPRPTFNLFNPLSWIKFYGTKRIGF